jgi:hypothetical protein
MPPALQRVYEWVRVLIGRGRPAPVLALVPAPDPTPPKKVRATPPPDDDEREVPEGAFGGWAHFSDILNQLDNYFAAIRLLRKTDPETYKLYGRVGGLVTSGRHWYEFGSLNPYWRLEKRPSFGLIHFAFTKDHGPDGTSETVPVRLAYLTKYERRAFLQPVHDEIYEVNVVYVSKYEGKDTPLHAVWHVAVTADGRPYLLKEFVERRVKLPRSIKRKHRYEATINSRQWEVPYRLRELYLDRKKHGRLYEHENIEEFGVGVFALIANAILNAHGGAIQVRVKSRDKLAAMFTVDMVKVPQFFAKREKSYNDAGNAHRIFHVVRPHKRTLAGGHVKYVKMHFRGERVFSWLGYDVNITVPGKHHADFLNLTSAAVTDETNLNAELVDSRQLGRIVADNMEGKR